LTIHNILETYFGAKAPQIFALSPLIQYINLKTRSSSRSSKSRSSYANLYALYVLVEDYLKNDFLINGQYNLYQGARYHDLLQRQRELPFGQKLQNHALNNRVNTEFEKYFPLLNMIPIIHRQERYWINENLLKVEVENQLINIAPTIIPILDAYIHVKQANFEKFIADCQRMATLDETSYPHATAFIQQQMSAETDARIFEIVSFAILKVYYADQHVYWGWQLDNLQEDTLTLYKTGRTNANDGGIDFVMRPLGRFFQVTETLDVKKYFLDIDKVNRFPISFVIKSETPTNILLSSIRAKAQQLFSVESVVNDYMSAIEEIINLPELIKRFDKVLENDKLQWVMSEIIIQSKLEFNYPEADD
jgi:hypothetical protein